MQRFVLSCLLVGMLGGCATYHPQPLTPTQSAAAFQARSLDDPGVRDFLAQHGRRPAHWPKTHWDLDDLALLGIYESPALDVQRALWQRARAGIVTAGQRPNPRLNLLSEHHSLTAGGISPWTLGLNLDLPIETAGKRGDRLEQAKALANDARLRVAEAVWDTRRTVRQRFLDYFSALTRSRMRRVELDTRGRMLALLQQRQAVGENSSFAVNAAALQWQQARQALASEQERIDVARARLAQALGLPLSALNDMRFSFSAFEQSPSAQQLPSPQVQRAALLNRLDIRRALARYAGTEAKLKLEIAKQYPNLHFGPGYSWDQGDNRWGLGLSLALPILNQNQGPIAEARAQRAEAAAAFIALQAQVIGEIEQAMTRYRGALESLSSMQALLDTQARQQRMITQRFQAGESDRLALQGAELERIAAERNRFDALLRAQQALGLLEDAVQQPLTAGSTPMPTTTGPGPMPSTRHGTIHP